MKPTQQEIQQVADREFNRKKDIVKNILASYDIALDDNMEGQSAWVKKYMEYLNTDRITFQKNLGDKKVFANLENLVLERTRIHSGSQLNGFIEFVYDFGYNPILDS
jgi:hypothetical protein